MSKRSRAKQIKKISYSIQSRAMVDIVTPVFGSPDLLRELIVSFMMFEPGIDWTWTFVDDLGPNREEIDEIFSKLPDTGMRVLRNKKNSGFAATNNHGFAFGSAPLLLLLNSDTLITHDGWLKKMAEEFAQDPTVGIVGSKLLFFDPTCPNYVQSSIRPDGKVQHAGVAFNLVGNPYHIFLNWSPGHPKVNMRREMNAVTAACLMTRRDVYTKLGGLDIEYGQGNFEDVQYCLQVRALGGKVIYTPEVTLRHFAGGSGNSDVAKENLKLFHVKCKRLIAYDDWRYL